MGDRDIPLVYVIAGEESGDRLGGGLMAALKHQTGGRIEFAGIGGTKMTAEGLNPLFPMEDLAVMGLTEVLPRLPKLLQRIKMTAEDVTAKNPAALITIDAPDFNFRVAKKLVGKGIPLIHYVAPSVWAWRPGRAKKIAGFLDHLLTLLPFEPPYFEKHGLGATYVGHPILQSGADAGDAERLRSRLNVQAHAPLLTILPGSRAGECSRMLPVFGGVIQDLQSRIDGLHVLVPVVPGVKKQVAKVIEGWKIPAHILDGDQDKYDAFAASRIALAASGTVSLELAIAGTPAVIGYRVASTTTIIAKRLVKTPYVNLVNILLEREAIPEFLLERCRADLMADACMSLWSDDEARLLQKKSYLEALEKLEYTRTDPNRRAAEAVLSVIIDANENGAA